MESSSVPCICTDTEPDQTLIHGTSNTPSLQQLLAESTPSQHIVTHLGFNDLLYAIKDTVMPRGNTGGATGGKAGTPSTSGKGTDLDV